MTGIASRWAQHLRTVAGAALPEGVPPALGALADPFLSAVIGRAPAAPRPAEVPPGEVGLWWAAIDPAIPIEPLLPDHDGGAALLPQGLFRTIEVWTDSELCAMHAMWRIARTRNDAGARRRLDAALQWHLEHTQPDNATNRPWALHVFLLAGTPESVHYAETLLHNTQAGRGRMDEVSALILVDAAGELEEQGTRARRH